MEDKKFSTELSVIEQHAEQLRAEVLGILFSAGVDYTEALQAAIADATEEDNTDKKVFGLLAEIGWCDVFSRAGRAQEAEDE